MSINNLETKSSKRDVYVSKRSYPLEECVCFNSYNRDNYVLSNMYPCEIDYEGMRFKSVDMMYWWLMFRGEDSRRKRIRDRIIKCGGICNGYKCRKIGLENEDYIDDEFVKNQFKILESCIIAKAKCCREFREKLRESKGKWLVEEAGWDYEKAGAILNSENGCMEGGNACGRLMMEVRDMLFNGELGEFND